MINMQMIQRNLYLKILYLMIFDKEDHSCVTSCVITYLNVALSFVVSNQNITIIIYQKILMNDQKEENGRFPNSLFVSLLVFYLSILNLSIFQVTYFDWTKTTYFLNAHFQQLWTETTTTKIRRIKTRIKRERIMRSLCRRKICHLLSFTGQVIQVSDLFCKTK